MAAWLDKVVKDTAGEPAQNIRPGTQWQADANHRFCFGCAVSFSLIVRRHHCRLCGHLFCSQCAKHFIPPVKGCPDQTWRRVCKFCRDAPQSSLVVGAPHIRLVQHHVHFQCLQSLSAATEPTSNNCVVVDAAPIRSTSLPAPAATPPIAAAKLPAAAATLPSSLPSQNSSSKMMRQGNPFLAVQGSLLQASLNRQASFPYKTAMGEGALTWEVPPALDIEVGGSGPPVVSSEPGPQGMPELEPNLVGMHKRILEAVSDKHLSSITQQLLKGENVKNPDVWVPVIMNLAKEATASTILSAQRISVSRERDPRSYVKVKKLPEMGTPAESQVVNGVVCKKNVANRRMRSNIENPRIALLANSLEFARQANSLSHFDSVLDKEKDALSKSVERIIDVGPDVLVVEKNVARSVQEQLLVHNITLVQNVKMDLLERLKRTTNAQIFPSVSDLTEKGLGICSSFTVEPLVSINRCNSTLSAASMASALALAASSNVAGAAATGAAPLTPPGTAKAAEKTRDGGGQKTLMFFNGVPHKLGCTVLLKGAPADELRRVKRVVSFMIYAMYHANLELTFLAEQMSVGLVAVVSVDGFLEMPEADGMLQHMAQMYIQNSADTASRMPCPNGIVSTSPYIWRDKTEYQIEEVLAPSQSSRGLSSMQSARLRSLGSFRMAEMIQEDMDAKSQASSGVADPSTSTALRIEPVDNNEAEPSTSGHGPSSFPPCHSPAPVSPGLAVAISKMPYEAASTSSASLSPLPSSSRPPGLEPDTQAEPSGTQKEADLVATPSRLAVSSLPEPLLVFRPATPEFTDPLRRPAQEEDDMVDKTDDPQTPLDKPIAESSVIEADLELIPTKSQDAGLLDIYKQQHIYITVSNRNPKRNMFCEPHLIRQIVFYGPEDLSLANFIIGSCPHPAKKCLKEDCGEGVTCHVKTFMHGNHRITMSFVSLPQEAALPYDDRIWFWARPKGLGSTALKSVRRTLLSKTSTAMSLGRFLELCLCGHALTVLDLRLHTDFVRYFGVGRAVMCMHQDRINTSRISMPSIVMQYTTNGQLTWLALEGGELLQEAKDLFDWVECALPGLAIFQDPESSDTLNLYICACRLDRSSFSNSVHQAVENVKHEVLVAEAQGSAEWVDILVAGVMDLNCKRRQLALAQLVWAAFMKDSRFFDRVPFVSKLGSIPITPAFVEFPSPDKARRYTYSMDSMPVMETVNSEGRRSHHTMSLDTEQLEMMAHKADLSNLGVPIMTVANVSISAVMDLLANLEPGLLDGSESLLQQAKAAHGTPTSAETGTEPTPSELPEEPDRTGNITPPPSTVSSNGTEDGNDPSSPARGPEDEGPEDEDPEQEGGSEAEDEVPAAGWAWPASHNIDVHNSVDDDQSGLFPICTDDDEESGSVGYRGDVLEDRHVMEEQASPGDRRSLHASPEATQFYSPTGTAVESTAAGTAVGETVACVTAVEDWGTPKSAKSGEEAEVMGPFRATHTVASSMERRAQSAPQTVPESVLPDSVLPDQTGALCTCPDMVLQDKDQLPDANEEAAKVAEDTTLPDAATSDAQAAGCSGTVTKNPVHQEAASNEPEISWRIGSHLHASTSSGEPTSQLPPVNTKIALKPLNSAPAKLKSKSSLPAVMEFEKNAKLPMPGRAFLAEGIRGVVIPIFDGEPTSMVSHFLASKAYRKHLSEYRRTMLQSLRKTDDKKEDWEHIMLIKERESTTLRLDCSDESLGLPSAKAKFQVIAHYSAQFSELRNKCLMGGEEAFMASLCRCRRWQNRGGKSNAYFARTRDERFIIKGLSKAEKQSLLEFAPAYFAHLSNVIKGNQTSSLAKIFGVFTVNMKSASGSSSASGLFKDGSLDIIIMENIFYDHNISRIYDLKGSERARFNQEAASNPNDTGVVHLDDNLRRNSQTQPILVDTTSHHHMETALWHDTDFLSGLGVMDYSLLVGVDRENNQLLVALIDYIRTYTWDKQLETWVKSSGILGGGGKEPTIISPKQYMKRFRTAMQTYFTMVPNSSHLEPPLQPDASLTGYPQQDGTAGDRTQAGT